MSVCVCYAKDVKKEREVKKNQQEGQTIKRHLIFFWLQITLPPHHVSIGHEVVVPPNVPLGVIDLAHLPSPSLLLTLHSHVQPLIQAPLKVQIG